MQGCCKVLYFLSFKCQFVGNEVSVQTPDFFFFFCSQSLFTVSGNKSHVCFQLIGITAVNEMPS